MRPLKLKLRLRGLLIPAAIPMTLLVTGLLLACQRSEPEAPGAAAAEPAAPAAAVEPGNPRLTVEGSAFVLALPDGRVLRGAEFAGATVHFAMGGNQVAPIRLATITPDPERPEILRHDFQTQDKAGQWVPACAPDAYGERWGFPVALPENHPGREHAITLTCASGAVGKCARWGYPPWMKGPGGEDLVPLHAACVRMVRADYCGDGVAHTKEGTSIDNYDDLGIQKRGAADDASYVFEAGWSPQGAVCVAHPRWSDLITLEQLNAQCPRLALVPVCSEDSARALGARMFNTSRLQTAADAAAR